MSWRVYWRRQLKGKKFYTCLYTSMMALNCGHICMVILICTVSKGLFFVYDTFWKLWLVPWFIPTQFINQSTNWLTLHSFYHCKYNLCNFAMQTMLLQCRVGRTTYLQKEIRFGRRRCLTFRQRMYLYRVESIEIEFIEI